MRQHFVLVAAQGAEPQTAKDIHEPNHDRVYCVRCGGNWPCQPAPVLPSSGVDETKEELEGSARAAVRLLTGFTDAELDELGGFEEEKK